MDVWKNTGFAMLVFLAGLQNISPDYYESAQLDGANRWLIFWQVMLPQSGRALLAGLILSWARALGEFGATILFAGNLQGRTQTMPLLVYGALEQDLRVTFVTALILLGLAVVAFTITRWLAGEEHDEGDTPTFLR